jgi:hypothetical protein
VIREASIPSAYTASNLFIGIIDHYHLMGKRDLSPYFSLIKLFTKLAGEVGRL